MDQSNHLTLSSACRINNGCACMNREGSKFQS
ncbi:hypothetical protein LINPERHAP1_LOCUS189, partial [Linum perenne]